MLASRLRYSRLVPFVLLLPFAAWRANGQEKPAPTVPPTSRPPAPGKVGTPGKANTPPTATVSYTILPTRPWNGLLTIQARVKETSIAAALCTGMSESVVIPRAQETLGLKPTDEKRTVHAFDEEATGPAATLSGLKLQALAVPDVRVALIDALKWFTSFPLPDAPALWLGSDFLSRYQVMFDFPAKAVRFYPPDSPLPGGKGSVAVPLEMREGRPWVRVSVPHLPAFWALVDTGTVGTLIPAEVGEKLKLQALKTLPVTRADGQKAQVRLAVLPKLSVGKAEQEEVPTLFLADKAPVGFHREMAILGRDFLNRYKVTLDYTKLKMVLQPPDKPKSTVKPKPKPDEDDEPAP